MGTVGVVGTVGEVRASVRARVVHVAATLTRVEEDPRLRVNLASCIISR